MMLFVPAFQPGFFSFCFMLNRCLVSFCITDTFYEARRVFCEIPALF